MWWFLFDNAWAPKKGPVKNSSVKERGSCLERKRYESGDANDSHTIRSKIFICVDFFTLPITEFIENISQSLKDFKSTNFTYNWIHTKKKSNTIRRKYFHWIKVLLRLHEQYKWKKLLLGLKVLPVTFKNPFTIEWMQWALSLKVYIACVVMIALWMDETEEWWSDANHLWCARAAAQCTLLLLLH